MWARAKPYVTELRRSEPPSKFQGRPLEYPQYQSDVVRLQVLINEGGIYLDNDMLTLRPMHDLMQHTCVLGGEGYANQQFYLNSTDPDLIGSVTNAAMLCEPNSEFMKLWLDATAQGLDSGDWAHHAVVTPKLLWAENQDLVHMLPVEAFIPFGFWHPDTVWIPYVFREEYQDQTRLQQSYTMHLWESFTQQHLSPINDDYLKTSNTIFAQLFRKYAQ